MASGFRIADGFRFEAATRELTRIEPDGSATPVPLGSRAADMLLLFLQRGGELVSKTEIMQAVWPNTAVDDSNLPVQIAAVRRALDSGRDGASAILTVPGRGYRFTLPVREESAVESSSAASPPPERNAAQAGDRASGQSQALADESSREAASGGLSHIRRLAGAPLLFAGAVAATVLVVAVVIAVHWGVGGSNRPMPRLSIAVLPFVNATGIAGNDELASLLTDDVTTGFGEVRGSFVLARSTVQAALARKPSDIGKELGVGYVLAGSLRQAEKGVELRVQLTDAMRGASVWTGQSAGPSGEPGDVSTRIVRNLMFGLTTAFIDAEAQRLSAQPADTLNAQDLVLQVRASVRHQPLSPDREAANVATLERALALEPRSAATMIELATEILRPVAEFDDRPEWLQRVARARGLVKEARAIEGESESLLALQALIHYRSERYTDAIAAYTSLLRAHPASAVYREGLARSLFGLGRSEDAIPLLQEAIKLDHGEYPPQDLYENLGEALMRVGRDTDALEWLRAADEQSSDQHGRIKVLLAVAYAHTGDVKAARREFAEYAERSPIIPLETVRQRRHQLWGNAKRRLEIDRLTDGLAIAGLRDHVDEDAATGLAVATGLRPTGYHAPTPLGAPGVALMRTAELAELMKPGDSGQSAATDAARPIVISVVRRGSFDIAFPGAVALPDHFAWGNAGSKGNADQRRALKAWVDGLLGGNTARRLVTMGWSAEYWNARNLAIELADLGYANVAWYRGGLEAWDAAGLPTTRSGGPP
jgi:DNA-binding winged helix-turn-helix (wHTH) protein/TolB-like protein/tetratricopeptide (TPR) repeat protein